MLRDPALVPLSHQHQHALALCVRISRAKQADLPGFAPEVFRLFDQEIRFHFDAEEHVLFPVAERFPELRQLVDDLRHDHVGLRAAATSELTPLAMREFARRLATHVRREESELFEAVQKLVSAGELARLGAALTSDFAAAGMPGVSCGLRR